MLKNKLQLRIQTVISLSNGRFFIFSLENSSFTTTDDLLKSTLQKLKPTFEQIVTRLTNSQVYIYIETKNKSLLQAGVGQ